MACAAPLLSSFCVNRALLSLLLALAMSLNSVLLYLATLPRPLSASTVRPVWMLRS